MDKYKQIEIWETHYKLEHPHIEDGYNKADILEWLAENVVNKNCDLALVSSSANCTCDTCGRKATVSKYCRVCDRDE